MKVVVTGGTGFLGAHIVNDLLEKGYNVRATVRNKNDNNKVGFLHKLAEKHKNKGGKLELWNADLMQEGSFDEAINGADAVIHCAAAVTVVSKNPQKEIIDPSIKGTNNVLSSIKKSLKTVKTLVMTGSVEAVVSPSKISPNYVFTEKDWNEDADPKHSPYGYAKVLAEKAVMEFSKQFNLRLVVICPALVMGPLLNNTTSISHEVILASLNGQYPFVPRISHEIIDVRDVSKAHIIAIEKESIQGRYTMGNKLMSLIDICRTLKQVKVLRENYFIPSMILPNFMMYFACLWEKRINVRWLNEYLDKTILMNNDKIKKDFGFKEEWISSEQAVVDSAISLRDGNHIKVYNNIYIFSALGIVAILVILIYLFRFLF
eukprot:TRINITY_DN770_c0_g1_i1.p1 TRINITY_DN770_c0_g1~~TRINITY_DN770_c0_g1_i1.p1  ORF type:complete len:375 (-),score=112.99 TRINITY_DN770_c0_g1_i1:44-1168(-)